MEVSNKTKKKEKDKLLGPNTSGDLSSYNKNRYRFYILNIEGKNDFAYNCNTCKNENSKVQLGVVSGAKKDKNKVNLDTLQIPDDKNLFLWNG